MKFWQSCRNSVGKNTKKTPKFHKRWRYAFFEQNCFSSIKIDSWATKNAFLTTLAKSPSKNPQVCHSESENLEKKLLNFWKRKTLSSKCSYVHVKCSCDHPAGNFSSKLWKPFAWFPETMKQLCAFQTKLFLLKMFVRTCTMEFWQACRKFVARNTENFPELQKGWSYNFLNKFLFFKKNDSLATENAFLATLAKFFSENPQICTPGSKKWREKLWIYRTKIIYPQIVLLYMLNPFLTTPWKIWRQNSEDFLLEVWKGWKICALSKQNKFSPKCSSEHAQWNFDKPAVRLSARIRKTLPNSTRDEYTFCRTKMFFFEIKNDSLATENAILTTLAKTFL